MMQDWDIYEDMLREAGVAVSNKKCLTEKSIQLSAPIYRVSYPEDWYIPTKQECYNSYDIITKKYIPYKRLSHFREHLNRLNYCQDVNIPKHVWMVACHVLSQQEDNSNSYQNILMALKQQKLTKYNEHIHHLISKYTGVYMDISYSDRKLLCQLFLQIEQQFKRNEYKRKNMFSYYNVRTTRSGNAIMR